jgi:hypothetical protein
MSDTPQAQNKNKKDAAGNGSGKVKAEKEPRQLQTFATLGGDFTSPAPDESLTDGSPDGWDSGASSILSHEPSALLLQRTSTGRAEKPGSAGSSAVMPTFGGRNFCNIPVHSSPRPAIQFKLTVGAAHDPYEQEADRVAEQVMRMPPPVPAPPSGDDAPPKPGGNSVQREAEEEEIQTKRVSAADSFDTNADFEGRVKAGQGGGSPLPVETRAFMEPRFGGMDFSGVRVHSGGEAADLNRQVSARAFTLGKDIYLGEGQTDVASDGGKRLLAHELTLQRAVGNQAVQRMLDRPIVQRYQEISLNGELDLTIADHRAELQSQGFNGFGDTNHGWIRVATPNGEIATIKGNSQDGYHTEEVLIDKVRSFVDFNDEPRQSGKWTIVELYTERQPCNKDTLHLKDPRRWREGGSCSAWLGGKLHPLVKVYFSVKNAPIAFADLMGKAQSHYVKKVVNGELAGSASLSKLIQDKHEETYGIRGRNYAFEEKLFLENYREVKRAVGEYAKKYGDLENINRFLVEFSIECKTARDQKIVGTESGNASTTICERIRQAKTSAIDAIGRKNEEMIGLLRIVIAEDEAVPDSAPPNKRRALQEGTSKK